MMVVNGPGMKQLQDDPTGTLQALALEQALPE